MAKSSLIDRLVTGRGIAKQLGLEPSIIKAFDKAISDVRRGEASIEAKQAQHWVGYNLQSARRIKQRNSNHG